MFAILLVLQLLLVLVWLIVESDSSTWILRVSVNLESVSVAAAVAAIIPMLDEIVVVAVVVVVVVCQ